MLRQPILVAALVMPVGGWADCASDAEIAAFVQAAANHQPTTALGASGDMEDALCTQARLAEALEPQMGKVIGYKAGLTSPSAQERFGVTSPVRGLLYENMMLPDGAEVPKSFGAIPMVESDLILVVGDATINQAASAGEVMSYISAVHPFIELPDLTLAQGEPMTGITLTAMGVGAKLGILGPAIPVDDSNAMTAALADMTVILRDGAGEIVSEAPGTAVLDHPANAVLWLISDGVVLKAGDLISVGSFGPLMPTGRMAGGATAQYDGLPGNPSISVRFTE